jgi:hypothetical protein
MPPKNQVRTHRQELQRIQVGLVGLAAVLLIVTLANLVIQTARGDGTHDGKGMASAQVAANANGANSVEPSEPLADLGVTPSTEPTIPYVPDLEPDPRLRERMDRDPEQSQ